jgi:hypothetical protein
MERNVQEWIRVIQAFVFNRVYCCSNYNIVFSTTALLLYSCSNS